jgi:asparagine N-glycosylation enzyme membrane subunit Stt3
MSGDDELSVDFGKMGDWLKRKKKPEAAPESMMSDTHASTPHHEHPPASVEKGDDISIDFSKITGFFKKKQHAPAAGGKDELGVDFSGAWGWVKKHPVLVILTILLLIQFVPTKVHAFDRDFYAPWGGVWMRLHVQDIPAADGWASDHVTTILRNQIKSGIDQQYPNLPDDRKNKMVDEQWAELYKQQGTQIQQQIEAVRQQIQAFWKYEDNGQQYTYMPNIDPYTYLRYARNMLEKGHIEDERKNGVLWDNHMNSPVGGDIVPELQVYMLVWLNKLSHLFSPTMPLMQSSGYLNVIFILLALIPAFLIGRRFAGIPGGAISATMVAIMPTIMERTAWDADTDIWNVFFPLLLTWLYIQMIDAEDRRSIIGWAALNGFVTGLYAFAWRGGWWYVFDFMLAAFGILVLTELVRSRKSMPKLVDVIKKRALVAAVFLITSGVFVSAFVGTHEFFNAPLQPAHFTVIKAAAHPSLWPNVYTTVAELNPTSIAGAVGAVGGWLFFWIAVAGIALMAAQRKSDGWKLDFKYAPFFALWFVATIYASTKGVRFTLLLAPAFAVAFGIGLGKIYQWVVQVSVKDLKLNAKIPHVVMTILIIFMLSGQAKGSYGAMQNNVPIMNDAWWNALTAIKGDSQPNAVINSWWDFGHQFKYVADRPVTFDGASQNTPMAHWIGRVLATSNETEAVGILRMLDCGSNSAFDEINGQLNDPVKSSKILYQIIGVNKDAARQILQRNGMQNIDTILGFTHCNPPEDYFIASDDMIGKSGVWSHFGLWNFERAKAWIMLRNEDHDTAVNYMKTEWNYTDSQAEDMYSSATGLANENDANAWISPWPGILGAADCTVQAGTVVSCSNGVQHNLTNGETVVQVQQGVGRPPVIVKLGVDGKFTETHFNDSNLNIAVLLFPTGPTTWRSVLSSPELINSMFVRMYFLEGHGLKYFKEFNRQSFLTGGQAIVYKVDWSGNVTKSFSGLADAGNTTVHVKITKGAKEGDTVGVYYIGTLMNGSVFDSSIKSWKNKDITINTSFDGADLNPPLEFTVGAQKVIEGFDAAVRGMEVGDTQVVQIPPNAAYGFDPKKHFLGNQTLRFKIKMVSLEPKKAD